MKGIRWILLATAVLVLAALACGPVGTPTPQVPPTAAATPTLMPTNTPAPQPTSPPQEGATLEITNNSGVDVWYVYLSSSQSDQWGEDWLKDYVIKDGETYSITGIPAGTYDVKTEDQNNQVIEVVWGAEVTGTMTWTLTGLASIEITNNSGTSITYLYMSPSESDSWGDDWLGANEIGAGATYTVGDISRGKYDIKATDTDGNAIEVVYHVDLYGQNTWTVVGKTPVPDNAVVRFEEYFTDNRNNWGLNDEDENRLHRNPANGEYCILIKSTDFTAWEWYEPFRTDQFIAEVSCYITGAEDASCGLGFGPDGDNEYWFEVSPSDQTIALFLLENGTWQEKLIDWTTSKSIDPDGTNYLSMERVSGVVSLYVNGVLAGQINSDRFPTGRIGIGGSTYNQGNATICLDNLRVWRLE